LLATIARTTADAATVSGKVIDKQTGRPVKRFHVVPGTKRAGWSYWSRRDGQIGLDGHFRMDLKNRDLVRIEADGFEPAESRAIRGKAGNVTIDFELTKGQNFDATVLTPDGQPAAQARVAVRADGEPFFHVTNGVVDAPVRESQETDARGRIHFPPQGGGLELLITHDSGYARFHPTATSNHRLIVLDPWTRVEGTYRFGGKPLAGFPIEIDYSRLWGFEPRRFVEAHQTRTGPEGRFVFERVMADSGVVGRSNNWPGHDWVGISSTSGLFVRLPVGKTVHVDIGEKGRPVIGTLHPQAGFKQKVDWSSAVVDLAVQTNWGMPGSHFTAPVRADGSFRTDPLPAGVYSMDVRFLKAGPGHVRDHTVVVETWDPDGNVTQPLDLGVVTLDKN
jgi:hypothetical protein